MTQHLRSAWTLESLRSLRTEILALAEKNRASDVRIFGSLARGETNSGSDVDFLVTFQPEASIFDQIGLWLDLQDLLACEVDVLADHPDAGSVTQTARLTAIPL